MNTQKNYETHSSKTNALNSLTSRGVYSFHFTIPHVLFQTKRKKKCYHTRYKNELDSVSYSNVSVRMLWVTLLQKWLHTTRALRREISPFIPAQYVNGNLGNIVSPIGWEQCQAKPVSRRDNVTYRSRKAEFICTQTSILRIL